MKAKRRLLFQILAVVLLVAIGYTMTIIGRGHTIYLDSKTLEYDGQTYKPAYKTVVYVDGQQVAKLYDKERGVATCIGQMLTVTLEITQQKGGTEEVYAYNIPVPRKMDNVIINLPGFLAGLPEEAYLSEFIPSPDEVAAEASLQYRVTAASREAPMVFSARACSSTFLTSSRTAMSCAHLALNASSAAY